MRTPEYPFQPKGPTYRHQLTWMHEPFHVTDLGNHRQRKQDLIQVLQLPKQQRQIDLQAARTTRDRSFQPAMVMRTGQDESAPCLPLGSDTARNSHQ